MNLFKWINEDQFSFYIPVVHIKDNVSTKPTHEEKWYFYNAIYNNI